MGDDMDFRVGDVLSVACPFTATRVTRLERDHVSLEWPWWGRDPDSESFHWNGIVAIGVATDADEWTQPELFRTDPPPEHLASGDACRVGVPPTVAHVTAVDRFDPPLETGWLPRPRLAVAVLPRGRSVREFPDGGHLNGTGYELHPGDGIPFTFELLFRPYAFLEPGDEVADAAGRAWRFDGPWDWYAFDGGTAAAAPEWPLALLTRGGAPCAPEPAGEVAAATVPGSHAGTLAEWTRRTDAAPTRAGRAVPLLR
ncbi:hypothetical protein [Streptomyces thermolilacinus]|uniref:Uncharacterized protein n=1 Tax=Streptomyces thermolilacinus SPC6 TaxID=1306406 RepID=A0A1D3DZ81_9ACTN|nr:hypothetical protein [Streptomyces thermolilacinus]OEJ97627.1 hypothetical protein J116_027405 [Streptomyces thermolilacinus SPC6]